MDTDGLRKTAQNLSSVFIENAAEDMRNAADEIDKLRVQNNKLKDTLKCVREELHEVRNKLVGQMRSL